MQTEIEVKFTKELSGYDVFRSLGQSSRSYVRIPMMRTNAVQWGSVSICGDYVEPERLLPDSTIVHVMDRRRVLFSETVLASGMAEAVGKSSAEYEMQIALQFQAEHYLLPYEKWRSRLLSYMSKDYAGFTDTWLFCEVRKEEAEIVRAVRRLGQVLYISRSRYHHKLCPAEWELYTLTDGQERTQYAICGYGFIG